MWKILSDPILSLIYPQECSVCHGEVGSSDDGIACSGCWAATKIFDGNETLCLKCGAFLLAVQGSTAAACRRCESHAYDQAFSIGLYEHALSASVLRLKRVPHLCRRLRRQLIETFKRVAPDPKILLIPVPLSTRRQHERGFNQAAVLARLIAKHAKLSIDESTLTRTVHTPMHRAGMDRKARAMTVQNAFRVVRPKLIEGRPVLLVDDVFTSGETASTCASVLKKNGASTVSVLTVARAA